MIATAYTLREMIAVFHWTGSVFAVEVCGHEIATFPTMPGCKALVEQHNARLSESL